MKSQASERSNIYDPMMHYTIEKNTMAVFDTFEGRNGNQSLWSIFDISLDMLITWEKAGELCLFALSAALTSPAQTVSMGRRK